jgi:hypothetical protein
MSRVNVTARQWSGICKVVNGMLPAGIEHRDGGILPSMGTMNMWLDDNGGRLKMRDVKLVAIEAAPPTPDFDGIEDTALLDPWASCAKVDEPISVHGYFVMDAMNRCIRPELEYIEGCWPGALRFWQTRGGVDILLAADGLSRPLFNGRSAKLELGAAMILLPTGGPWTQSTGNAQQAACLATPLFMHDGDECYSSLKATLAQMFEEQHLANQVSVRAAGGEAFELPVMWHLYADLKMVSLVTGLGGASNNKPCFLCHWDRSKPTLEGETQTDEGISLHSTWATKYLKPMNEADTRLSVITRDLKDAKDSGDVASIRPPRGEDGA